MLIGIGDDAAILSPSTELDVITTDMLMDGVDFRTEVVPPEEIGRKALAVNLSDLAAMGARPVAAFISIALPKTGGREISRRLYDGLLHLAHNTMSRLLAEIPIAGTGLS